MIVISQAAYDDLKSMCKSTPLEEGALDEAHENADDGGNFNDTLDRGFDIGYRTACDELREILGLA